MTTSAKILQINYKLNGPRAEYERENLPYAEPIANIPDLRWKVWIMNEAQSEAGGIYLFDNDTAVQAFLNGPIVAEMKGDPTLSIKAFDVIAELTTITRGPVK
ncbi:YdhR family protein [Mesorhizobium dulcispinae]|uniref:YdhR family protein n=1 Tax=Mesorhizobium dulcispinae TaxID=3072316 RepID=UPI002A2470D5|nr:YdhR family protein [Mesorhizobium sp. VK23D]MDX8519752.1 YdhR family protein [Mesorhizobium sp. VK23D]